MLKQILFFNLIIFNIANISFTQEVPTVNSSTNVESSDFSKSVNHVNFAPEGVLDATVSGNAYLQGDSDHAGISVLFIAESPSAVTDSTITNSVGAYSISLAAGNYHVCLYKIGYQTYDYPGIQTFADVHVLNDVTLQPGTIEEIYGDISGTFYKNTIYIVKGNVVVPDGQTLTIQPGTWIKFDSTYTFATKLVSAGADILAVKELLGHQDIRTSMVYAKANTDTLRDAIDLLNN